VEFVHKSEYWLNREVGIHANLINLKASLREDPDIILIGEMRDRETVNTALKASRTVTSLARLYTLTAMNGFLSAYNLRGTGSVRDSGDLVAVV